jgi:seryl-tRNA synthetase
MAAKKGGTTSAARPVLFPDGAFVFEKEDTMLDLTYIREHPGEVKAAMVKLNAEAPIDLILELDAKRRGLLTEVEALRAERNAASKEMGRFQRRFKEVSPQERPALEAEFEAQRQELRQLGDRIKVLDMALGDVETQLQNAQLNVPNLPHESVPVGKDESQNVVLRTEGRPRRFDFEPLPHWDLGPMLGIVDFERGVKLAGTRFYVLRGMGARLQRALITWMLDLHIREHGYTEIYPPAVVKREALVGAAQLPKFEENIYHDVEDDFWLIGTAEIPLTNLHRDEILDAAQLPLNYVAYTPCFRREKMSAGRETRGLKRGHQFDKVEMYKLTTPESSYAEMETLLAHAEAVCHKLEIPYRVVEMCTGDLGFQAAKKYDLELWSPGVQEWLEVSSISNVEAFQARRANIRYRPEPDAGPEFVHTLNGSGLALPRTMIAVMENYQQRDGSIVVPDVLRPYVGAAVIGQP